MAYNKKWRGELELFPLDPDLVLAKHTNWNPGQKRNHATSTYPEPCNLVAAAAYTKIPKDMMATESLIYQDERTGLWIQAVGTRLIPMDLMIAWCDLQRSGGAVATWTNKSAQLPRIQPNFLEQEKHHSQRDPITIFHLINEMGKYEVNGVDIKEIYKEQFHGIDLHRSQDYTIEDMKTTVRAKSKMLEDQKCGYSKCILTPQGVFPSVQAAIDALKLNRGVVYKWANDRMNGFKYISKEEYVRLKYVNKDEEQSS